MKPKKKGILIYIIYVLFLGAVVFLALHGAVVHQTVIDKIETGEIEEYELVLEFLDLFPLGVSAAPFSFTRRLCSRVVITSAFIVELIPAPRHTHSLSKK